MNINTIFLFAFTITLLATACNKDKDDNNPLPDVDATAGYMPGTKGMELTYTVTQGDEMGASSVMKITDVYDSSGYTVAKGTASAAGIGNPVYIIHNKEKTVNTVRPVAAYYESLSLAAAQYDVFTHEEHPYIITIPHNSQLHAVVFPETVFTRTHGEKNDNGASLVNDYTQTEMAAEIDSIGKITIKLGAFDCVRVHHIRKTHLHGVATDYDGSQTVVDQGVEFDEKEWYTPGLGVIKTEETNMNTGVLTVTELTKVAKP
jgi:hypothetical protein